MDMHGDAFLLLVVLDRQVEGVVVRFPLIKEVVLDIHRISIKFPFQQHYKVVIGIFLHDVGDGVVSSDCFF